MAHKNHSDYVAYHAAYRTTRREKLRVQSQQYRKAHPEIEKEYREKYLEENASAVKVRKNRHYLKNKEKYNALGRTQHLQRKFGITAEQKQNMIDSQDGKCAICGDSIDLSNGHTDHRHEPFQLRDILCRYCNPGLGNFKESPERLEKAAAYLRRHLSSQ